ncbi:hypothetical protein ACFLRT_02490 [Acidobacteriota bacterium]
MKKVFVLVILAGFAYFLFFYQGSEKLTKEKTEEIIAKDVVILLKKIVEYNLGSLPHEFLKWLEDSIAEMKKLFEIKKFEQENGYFVAKSEMKIIDETINIDIKLSRHETGWKIDEIKMPDGNWISVKTPIHPFGSSNDPASLSKKIKATMALLKKIGVAIEYYIVDNSKAPQVESVEELKRVLHIALPTNDPWGNDLYYFHGTGLDQHLYAIGSAGSDGVFEGFNQEGEYSDYRGKDIIFSNGVFILRPHFD